MANTPIIVNFDNGEAYFSPKHRSVDNWRFSNESKAGFVNYMAAIAEENGMSANDLHHLVPAILRMLKSQTEWAE